MPVISRLLRSSPNSFLNQASWTKNLLISVISVKPPSFFKQACRAWKALQLLHLQFLSSLEGRREMFLFLSWFHLFYWYKEIQNSPTEARKTKQGWKSRPASSTDRERRLSIWIPREEDHETTNPPKQVCRQTYFYLNSIYIFLCLIIH